ncbi:unnamed protein product [Penicillium pancosmium]
MLAILGPKMLLELPNELLLMVAEHSMSAKDINNLTSVNSQLYELLNKYLYHYNVHQCGSSGMLWAAENGQEATARKLLREGANPQVETTSNETPLHLAARNGHERLVQLFLCLKNADPDVKDIQQHIPLMWAARNGHDGVVNMLIRTKNTNINSSDSMGYTSLAWAARSFSTYPSVMGRAKWT